MKNFLVPIAALALAGCMTSDAAKADGSDVRLGQTAYVDGPKIRPIEVLEDSRCPMNARCIWAGRVKLKMLWIRPSGNKEFELSSDKPAPLADGMITLISVAPERVTNKKLVPSDYRFWFKFEGGL